MTGRRANTGWGRAAALLFLVLCFALPVFAQQQGQQKIVSATVQPATVTVGDSLTYQVAIVLTGAGQPSVAIPVIPSETGLTTPSPAGTQTSVESYITNGGFRSVQRITYNYIIRTTKEGTFTIPPATITINGRSYETESVDVEVRPVPRATDVPSELEGLVAAPQVSGHPELQRKLTGGVFVLPVLSNTEPYNGEQVRISYHLVIDPKALNEADLLPRTNLDGVSIPPMNDFITEELYPFPQDLKFQEREIGGKLFLVAPVYEAVITSTKTGKLQIEPFQISMLFSLRSQGTRGRSPFHDDPFFSSLSPLAMMGGNTVQVVAQSPMLTINVRPVPDQNRPVDFAGAVGEFSISAEVDKKAAKAYDDLISLDVTVSGKGNAESLSPPKLPDMPGFTVLGDPEQQTSGRKDGEDYVSVKKFSYTLRPTQPGQQSIPPVTLSYFEPEKKQFAKVSSDPISLEIAPGTRPAPPLQTPPPRTQDDADQEQAEQPDLRYIYTENLTLPERRLGMFTGASGIGLFMVPPALLAMAGFIAWNRNRLQHRRIDQRKVAGAASSQHLKEANNALNGGDTRLMAAELASGVRMYFASRFGISESEATIPEIEERLTRNGAPPDLVQGMTQVLEFCDSAQYAPGGASRANATDVYNEAMSLLKAAEAYT